MPDPYLRIRKQLAARIAPARLRGGLWSVLAQLGLVRQVVLEQRNLDDLVRIYLQFEENLYPPPRPLRERHYGEVPNDPRAQALTMIVGIRLKEVLQINSFRERHLGGKLMKAEEIPAWIAAQAAADGPAVSEYLRVPQSSENRYASPLHGPPWRDEYVRWLRAEAARVEADPECELPHSGDAPDRLLYPDAGRVRSIAICSHGVLGELKRFAVACSEGFRSGWSEEGAVRFALTGEMPWIVWGHIRVTYGVVAAAPQISITVHPRVAPKDLLAAYVRTREELIDGRESRRLDRKQAALAVFAEESTWAPAGWVELRERWNSEYRDRHPEWHYGAKGDPEARRFALDARSAWKRVTGEPWHDRRRRSQ